MKTFLIALIASLIFVPAALASGSTNVPVSGAGTLHVGITGNATASTFNFDSPTPVVEGAPTDISGYNNWQDSYVNVSACTRVVFSLVGADSGWHCTTESEGHPTSPLTSSYTANAVQAQVDLVDGIGHDCPFAALRLGACGNVGGDKTYDPVDLSPFYGVILGTTFSNICTTVDWTPNFYSANLTTLGCSGTTSEIATGSFQATCTGLKLEKGGCSKPKDFKFKNYKRRAVKSLSPKYQIRRHCIHDLGQWICPMPAPKH